MSDSDFAHALSWAVAAGAAESDVRAAWATGRAVDVPIGVQWDVLRVTTTVGRTALDMLTVARVATLGPVLVTPPRATIEFLIPPGYQHQWSPQVAAPLATSGHIRWPAPHVTRADGRRAACGRSWIVPPVLKNPPYTSPTDLFEAVRGSLAHHTAAAEAEEGWAVISAAARG